MREDSELLREHVEGKSDDAFRTLVERHAGMVHGTAQRIVQDAALADEIAQAVFILLARKSATLPAGTVLAGWLYQTARFVALGALRAERRRQQHHRHFASMNDPADSTAVWEHIKPHLDNSMAQLPASDRDVLVLRFLEGRSFAEVGSVLGMSEAAAKMRVGRALDKLRRALGRHGALVTAVALAPVLTVHAASAVPAAILVSEISRAALITVAPSPNLLLLVNEYLKLMAFQKLKTSLVAAAIALLLVGGGVTLFLHDPKPGETAKPTVPAASSLVVTTFEPMAGEWEGSYEMRSDDEASPRPQRVALNIRTSNQGRTCEIDLNVLDRNDRPTATFHFTHALNATGDRIITTEDVHANLVSLDGQVTEASHNATANEWSAAFHATRPNSADFTECRWARLGDDLTINRQDLTSGPQGENRLFSHLTLRPRSNKPRTAYNALPRGSHTFDGVTFQIQRVVNIIGARAGQAKGREFARISDPSVRGRGRHIHVLHTGDHGSSATGDYIWRLILHYADGGTERFDFAYDLHLRNFWRRSGDGPPTPTDPDTSLAWVGTSIESDRTKAELVVSRTTVQNPRPDVDVVGAEFVSLLGPSSAYVLAVTVSNDGPKPAQSAPRRAPNAPQLTLTVQNAAGQPEPQATLEVEFECEGFAVRMAPIRTNEAGGAIIDVPTELVRNIQFKARHPDGRIATGAMEVVAGQKEWSAQAVRFPE
jgi:RNA polymerase sigma factor (sigma-70 family)